MTGQERCDCREESAGVFPPFRWHGWRRVLVANQAAALAAALLLQVFRPSPDWMDFALSVPICLIYANSIGTLIAVTLTYYSRRLYNRSGPDLALLRSPLGWALRIGVILAATLAGTLIAHGILLAVGLVESRNFWREVFLNARFSAILALGFGISIFFYENLRFRLEQTTLELRTRQLEEERARKLAAEAQLSSLESRIHPHFLFNTLNSIAALIPEDPKRAEQMVGRLAALLRFSLDAHQRGAVPLSQELKIVADYLEIEKARFGGRLRYSILVPAELERHEVPALALQTLVENSVKYAIAPRRDGGEIRVLASADGERLELEVRDDGPGFTASAAASGHGLDNLRARLEALFGDGAALQILRRDAETVVRISLPQLGVFTTEAQRAQR